MPMVDTTAPAVSSVALSSATGAVNNILHLCDSVTVTVNFKLS